MATEKKISRKERDKQRHTSEILQAAEAVFAEKGFEGARMSDIAERAEFSVGYLYKTWGGKEDLYVSLVESKFREFQDYVAGRIATITDPQGQIGTLIDAIVCFIDQNKAFAKIMLIETSQVEARFFDRLKTVHVEYLEIIQGIVHAGIEKGIVVSLPPLDLALAFDGVIFSFAKFHMRHSPGDYFTNRTEALKEVLFQMMIKTPAETEKELNK